MGKEVTLKNIEIINAMSGLIKLRKLELPTKVSWNINKNMKRLTSVIQDYYDAEKILIEKYAEKDEDGKVKISDKGQYKVTENAKEFSEKMNELYQLEDTIDILTIQLSDLEKYEIDGETLDTISFMINEED